MTGTGSGKLSPENVFVTILSNLMSDEPNDWTQDLNMSVYQEMRLLAPKFRPGEIPLSNSRHELETLLSS